jgi:holin-like protein
MDALKGFTLLLLCQSAGEALARLAQWPLPGPVLGLVLLGALLQWPPVRAPVEAAAQPLLGHLSLLFVPVGVGVIGHLGLVGQYGVQMLVALVLSTWVGLLVAAWVLRALLPREGAAPLAP